MNSLGWGDFSALIRVKAELGGESGVEAEASEVLVLSLALEGQQNLQWDSQSLS